jgi:tRNA(fMet)-specific endonuclease VapC
MYLLDTNILSELIKKKPHPDFISKLKSVPPQSLCTSCICVFELRFGSVLRDDFDIFWQRIMDSILSRISILDFGEEEAQIAGDILAQLQKKGQILGVEDVYIAATALSNKCTLVTANTKHYKRINRLKLENWIS